MNSFFTIIGEITLLSIFILIIFMIITIILGIYLLKKDTLLFPRLLLFTLNITYSILKKICKFFKYNDLIIDRISIDLRNKINKKNFQNIDANDIIIILPHCLRAINCPSKLGSSGLKCMECGCVTIYEYIMINYQHFMFFQKIS